MGALSGLVLGAGLLLVWFAVSDPRPQSPAVPDRRLADRTRQLLIRAGADRVTLPALAALCATIGGPHAGSSSPTESAAQPTRYPLLGECSGPFGGVR